MNESLVSWLIIPAVLLAIAVLALIYRRRAARRPGPVEAAPDAVLSTQPFVLHARGGPVSCYLEVLSGLEGLPVYPLPPGDTRLGRADDRVDIALREPTVSRFHAQISLQGNRYKIFDRESSGGTWVNGERVPLEGRWLQHDDEIDLGRVRLRFRFAAGGADSQPVTQPID